MARGRCCRESGRRNVGSRGDGCGGEPEPSSPSRPSQERAEPGASSLAPALTPPRGNARLRRTSPVFGAHLARGSWNPRQHGASPGGHEKTAGAPPKQGQPPPSAPTPASRGGGQRRLGPRRGRQERGRRLRPGAAPLLPAPLLF